jgi:adenylate cyclase
MDSFRRFFPIVQLPLIVLWTALFLIAECGDNGKLDNGFLRESIYPSLRRLEGAYSDFKFRTRGPRPTKQKIVIVEIDDRAVTELARWPWHRDAIAVLVLQAMEAGAKVVGLDIVFPEPDQRVPDGVVELLNSNGLGDQVPQFETDLMLQRIIDLYKDRLVLGWMTDTWCRPAYDTPCSVTDPAALAALPAGFDKFAYNTFTTPRPLDIAHTPLVSAPSIVGNLPSYNEAAKYSGYLVNAADEHEEIVRRAQMVIFAAGTPYPSLPLAMARVGLGDELAVALDDDGRVERIALTSSKIEVPVTGSGTMTINFRGAGYHFPFVGAIDLINDEDVIPFQRDGKVEHISRRELFKDAYVLVGVTAMGARDLRNFPFGSNIPGTEGLATILDNILSGDAIRHDAGPLDWRLLLVLMTFGAFGFGLLMMRLEALPAMLSALGIIGALVVLDIFVVFGRYDVSINAAFLVGELLMILVATVAVKYVAEERGKKFIRSTFSKYLAPTVVDQMLADPSKLRLGGETRRLTIMMSDLRGFTSMAERMKPAEVLSVLNHYLGAMADIIVEHNGTIDEFIGDAILVIFGAPIEGKDDARRAVACSIAMQRAM